MNQHRAAKPPREGGGGEQGPTAPQRCPRARGLLARGNNPAWFMCTRALMGTQAACVYVHMHMHMHAQAHTLCTNAHSTCAYTHIEHTHTHMQPRTDMHAQAHVCTYMHRCIPMQAQAQAHICRHMHRHICTCTHKHRHTCTAIPMHRHPYAHTHVHRHMHA